MIRVPRAKNGHKLISSSMGLLKGELKLPEKGARLAPKVEEDKHTNHSHDDRHEERHGQSAAAINLL
jgi:predicted secreted Zn-dependent protease